MTTEEKQKTHRIHAIQFISPAAVKGKHTMLMSAHQKRAALGHSLAAFVVLLIATSARSQTVPIDDFDDRDLVGWEHVDSTIGQEYGPGSFSAESQSFVLKGGGLVPPSAPAGGFLGSLWEESSNGNYADGFLRGKIRAETEGSIASFVLRLTGDSNVGFNDYLFFGTTARGGVKGNGGLSINRVENNEVTKGWGIPTDFAADEDWMLEAGAVGDRITAKTWRVGEPEPDAPQLVVFDSAHTEGVFGVESNIHESPFPGEAVVHATFDDLTFTFPGPLGDFNNDGDLGLDDLDSLIRHLSGDGSPYFDVTNDRVLDGTDFRSWVKDLRGTWFGDANLDGEFDTADLVEVFQAGEYEDGISSNSTWVTGDWNADGEFDSGDLVAAFEDGGFEQGPRAVAAVPEPTGCVLLWPTFGLFALYRKRAGQ